jgi:hypothetical protein
MIPNFYQKTWYNRILVATMLVLSIAGLVIWPLSSVVAKVLLLGGSICAGVLLWKQKNPASRNLRSAKS